MCICHVNNKAKWKLQTSTCVNFLYPRYSGLNVNGDDRSAWWLYWLYFTLFQRWEMAVNSNARCLLVCSFVDTQYSSSGCRTELICTLIKQIAKCQWANIPCGDSGVTPLLRRFRVAPISPRNPHPAWSPPESWVSQLWGQRCCCQLEGKSCPKASPPSGSTTCRPKTARASQGRWRQPRVHGEVCLPSL